MFELGNVLKTDFAAWFMNGLYGLTSDSAKSLLAESTDYDYDIAQSVIQRLLHSEIVSRQENARNASAAISMVQSFEDAVSGIRAILMQTEELADGAANGIYTEDEREDMQEELETLGSELNDIVNDTKYNNNKLLSADGETISISIGNGSTINVVPRDLSFDAEALDLTTDEGAVVALSITRAAIEQADDYGDYLDTQIERLGSVESLIEFDIEDTISGGAVLERIITMQTALNAINQIVEQTSVLLAIQASVTAETALELLTTTE
ncbi:MAG: flagellin [Planctomycetota bacterium]|jgi:flagellin